MPREHSAKHKCKRVNICQQLLNRYNSKGEGILSRIVTGEEITKVFLLNFGLASETAEVIKFSIWSSSEGDALSCESEGKLQQNSEEYSEQYRGETASLFHAALHLESF